MRGLGDLDDVVDPGGVVAALVEGDHGSIEQSAHGPATLAAQHALARRRTARVAVHDSRPVVAVPVVHPVGGGRHHGPRGGEAGGALRAHRLAGRRGSCRRLGGGRRVASDSRRPHARCMVVPGMVEMANLTRWSGLVGAKNEAGPGISRFARPPRSRFCDVAASQPAGAVVTSLEDAVRRNVQPGDAVHVMMGHSRWTAAARELARQFWGTDPGFTLVMTSLGALGGALLPRRPGQQGRDGLLGQQLPDLHARTRSSARPTSRARSRSSTGRS